MFVITLVPCPCLRLYKLARQGGIQIIKTHILDVVQRIVYTLGGWVYIQSFNKKAMKSYKIKTRIVGPEGPKSWASKTGINVMILILIFVEKCL